jgi:hypothetical protein
MLTQINTIIYQINKTNKKYTYKYKFKNKGIILYRIAHRPKNNEKPVIQIKFNSTRQLYDLVTKIKNKYK